MYGGRIDKDIVKECSICQSSRKMSPAAPLYPCARPEKPWMRVHLDCARPFEGKMFPLIIDAYSKWLDIHTTISATTIELLRKSFSYLDLPEVIVSNNAATFTSDEFSEFVKSTMEFDTYLTIWHRMALQNKLCRL